MRCKRPTEAATKTNNPSTANVSVARTPKRIGTSTKKKHRDYRHEYQVRRARLTPKKLQVQRQYIAEKTREYRAAKTVEQKRDYNKKRRRMLAELTPERLSELHRTDSIRRSKQGRLEHEGDESHLLAAHFVTQAVPLSADLDDPAESNKTPVDDDSASSSTAEPFSYGTHVKCIFCGCCLKMNSSFAHMELYCLVRNNPCLESVVADCQPLDVNLHSLDEFPVCTCESVGRHVSEYCRNTRLLEAMSNPELGEALMDNHAYKDFLALVSEMPGGKQCNGYVYIVALYDAAKPTRTFSEFLTEDEFYVGFASDLASRAEMHRKQYLFSMHYDSQAKSHINLHRKMFEAECAGSDMVLIGLGDQRGLPVNLKAAGIFVESMTLIVLGIQSQYNSVLSLANRNVKPWVQQLFANAAEIVIPLLLAAYNRLYVSPTGNGIHVLTKSGQKLPFIAESVMPPLKANRTSATVFVSLVQRLAREFGYSYEEAVRHMNVANQSALIDPVTKSSGQDSAYIVGTISESAKHQAKPQKNAAPALSFDSVFLEPTLAKGTESAKSVESGHLAHRTKRLMEAEDSGMVDELFRKSGCSAIQDPGILRLYESHLVPYTPFVTGEFRDYLARELDLVENVDDLSSECSGDDLDLDMSASFALSTRAGPGLPVDDFEKLPPWNPKLLSSSGSEWQSDWESSDDVKQASMSRLSGVGSVSTIEVDALVPDLAKASESAESIELSPFPEGSFGVFPLSRRVPTRSSGSSPPSTAAASSYIAGKASKSAESIEMSPLPQSSFIVFPRSRRAKG